MFDTSRKHVLDKLIAAIPHLEKVKEASGDGLVFLVGGSVRDFLLDRGSYDWDFVVEGNAREVARRFADKSKSSFVPLDEQYGIYRVVPRDSGSTFDFAECRGSIENDLSLRDFTINAIAIHIDSGDLIDHCRGLKDLEGGVIRACQRKSIVDDPLRMVRAYRMKAMLGFEIEEQTRTWIRELAQSLEQIAWERIRDEVFRILKYHDSSVIFREMFHDGILSLIFPELPPMVGMSQNRFHRFDVFDHSFCALEEFEKLQRQNFAEFGKHAGALRNSFSEVFAGDRTRLELTKLAVLLHDIGKPATRRIEHDILYYVGHHTTGKEMWEKIADRLHLSRKEKDQAALLIELHLAPVFIPQIKEETERKRAIYRFFRDAGMAAPGTLLLSWADVEAGQGEALTEALIEHHHLWTVRLIEYYFNRNILADPPIILDGRDIMKILEITGSKVVGDILEKVREKSALGDITSHADAIRYVTMLKKKFDS